MTPLVCMALLVVMSLVSFAVLYPMLRLPPQLRPVYAPSVTAAVPLVTYDIAGLT